MSNSKHEQDPITPPWVCDTCHANNHSTCVRCVVCDTLRNDAASSPHSGIQVDTGATIEVNSVNNVGVSTSTVPTTIQHSHQIDTGEIQRFPFIMVAVILIMVTVFLQIVLRN